jgi:hypothetical protein
MVAWKGIQRYRDVQPNVAESGEPMKCGRNGAETDLLPTPGTVADIAWGRDTAEPHIQRLTVVDAEPPRLFELVPSGAWDIFVPSRGGYVTRLVSTP